MGFLDKAKAAAEQAAAKAKEGVEDVQLKRELGQAYGELGRKAFELVESGELSHPQLEAIVAKIRGLSEKAATDDASAPAAASAEAEPQDPDEPPAMTA
jgi:hypothetical protein